MTKDLIDTLFLLILFYFIFSFEIKHYIMMKLEKIDKSLINFELKNEWFKEGTYVVIVGACTVAK